MRNYSTGANRDDADHKLDYEGFLSPLVLRAFAEYMHRHRQTAQGMRSSDNWQKGIPLNDYMKSEWRHFFEQWSRHRLGGTVEEKIEACCGVMFNLQGYMHELLKGELGGGQQGDPEPERGQDLPGTGEDAQAGTDGEGVGPGAKAKPRDEGPVA